MNNLTPKFALFEVLKIVDIRKTGSKIEVGSTLKGLYYPQNGSIFFTDDNGQDWVFYVGDTCRIIEQAEQTTFY